MLDPESAERTPLQRAAHKRPASELATPTLQYALALNDCDYTSSDDDEGLSALDRLQQFGQEQEEMAGTVLEDASASEDDSYQPSQSHSDDSDMDSDTARQMDAAGAAEDEVIAAAARAREAEITEALRQQKEWASTRLFDMLDRWARPAVATAAMVPYPATVSQREARLQLQGAAVPAQDWMARLLAHGLLCEGDLLTFSGPPQLSQMGVVLSGGMMRDVIHKTAVFHDPSALLCHWLGSVDVKVADGWDLVVNNGETLGQLRARLP